MNKTFGIIGAILFVASVAVGYFCKFDGADAVAIALAGFAFASSIVAVVKKYKKEGEKFDWKFGVIIAVAAVGGALCAIGGYSNSIFATLAGAVLGILAIIFAVHNKTK